MTHNYLVPVDFTPVSEAAIGTAINLQRLRGGTLHFLHITSSDQDFKALEDKCAEFLAKQGVVLGDNVKLHVKEGALAETIAEVSTAIEAILVIMGTHGPRGFQKVFGSRALKVICACKAPFLVVQEKVSNLDINKIVVPFDLTKKSLAILNPAASLSHWFGAELMLLGGIQTDESLALKSKNNIINSNTILSKQNVPHTAKLLPRTRQFEKEVVRYAVANDAEMIAVGYYPTALLPFMDNFVQNLLTNVPQLPVLVVNAEEMSAFKSVVAF